MLRLFCLCFLCLLALPARAEQTWSLELTLPEGPGPHPVVVFLPGCDGWDPWVQVGAGRHEANLAAAGWGFARLDVLKPRGIQQICDSNKLFAELRVPVVADATAAARQLAADPRVDAGRIVFMGQSFGGSVALDLASAQLRGFAKAEPVYAGVVAYYPWCYDQYGFPPGVDFDTPTLVLGGAKDEWTPVRRCQRLVLKDPAVPWRVEVFADAYHSFDLDELPRFEMDSVRGRQVVQGNPVAAEASRKVYAAWLAELFPGP